MIPVFVSVTVTLTLAVAAPDESVTVPSKVALTACPETEAENPKSIAPNSTAIVKHQNLIRPQAASDLDWAQAEAEDWPGIPGKEEPNKFFMASHPTRFEITPDQLLSRKPLKAWNWFHTLTDRKPHVKGES